MWPLRVHWFSPAFSNRAPSSPCTRHVNLEGVDNITDAAVVALASACQKLVSLQLDTEDNITDAAIANVGNILKARRT